MPPTTYLTHTHHTYTTHITHTYPEGNGALKVVGVRAHTPYTHHLLTYTNFHTPHTHTRQTHTYRTHVPKGPWRAESRGRLRTLAPRPKKFGAMVRLPVALLQYSPHRYIYNDTLYM